MKSLILTLLAGLAGLLALTVKGQDGRAVRPAAAAPPKARAAFDPAQSVALFVGIRSFRDDETLQSVPYAVDDAIDLAYVFTLDPRVALVRPNRVVLALSDETPRKELSKRRLGELKRNGATVVAATQSQILKLLNRQAGLAGADGIFIVSFATHGFSDDGAQYLMTTNSLLREINTTIPTARVLDLVAASNATRSLILIDTCRERVRRQRSTVPEPLSAAPLIQGMALTVGQVVLYGAAAGRWAYDDDLRQNGVFTGAVLDGLQCRAGIDASGFVTINELAEAVERNVLRWIRANRDPTIRNATQTNIDGAARTMPLAMCSRRPPLDPPNVSPDVRPVPVRPLSARRLPLRSLLTECRTDGETLRKLYGSREPDDFVASYMRWRDGCVAVLRDLDERLPPTTAQASETVRFLSIANFWCATTCPEALSEGNCALFREEPRAERCFWDLDKAVRRVADVLVRHPSLLQTRKSQ
ncbi:MAG TPA: caspase family protein [Thermoanaerobaculia bacterium]|jgi:hypothetical protein|nr:caspase family protein [Thermoanaerobaculia bacterium]